MNKIDKFENEVEDSNIIEEEASQPAPLGQTRFQYLALRFKGKFNLKNTFAALKYPNYKLWFWGQIISLFGTWMQSTAEGYLIFELTHSPIYLGYVGFAAGIPAWLFMFYGGVISDRIPRKKIIITTQITMMLLAFIIAALTFFKVIQAWHIIALAFGLGIANAFDAPARQSFLLELVERDDLINAIALNSTMFNSARAVGPAFAGFIYALFGPAWCFTVNGLSFIGVITALMMMKLKPQQIKPKKRSVLSELKEGLKYSLSNPIIRVIIGLVAVINLFGLSFVTLIPAWAVTILHGDATTNGIMQSARGVGALSCALIIATLGKTKYTGRMLTFGSFLLPVLMIVFSTVNSMAITLLALVGTGAAIILVFNLSNALVQSFVPDELRGRVMAIYTFTSFGFLPIGALIIGFLAEHLGEPLAVLISALVTLTFAIIAWFYAPKLRAQ